PASLGTAGSANGQAERLCAVRPTIGAAVGVGARLPAHARQPPVPFSSAGSRARSLRLLAEALSVAGGTCRPWFLAVFMLSGRITSVPRCCHAEPGMNTSRLSELENVETASPQRFIELWQGGIKSPGSWLGWLIEFANGKLRLTETNGGLECYIDFKEPIRKRHKNSLRASSRLRQRCSLQGHYRGKCCCVDFRSDQWGGEGFHPTAPGRTVGRRASHPRGRRRASRGLWPPPS